MKIPTIAALFALAMLAGQVSAVPATQPSPIASSVPATQPAAGDIAELIHQLGADDFHARRDAGLKLKQIGKAAIPALKEARQSKDPEIQARADELLQEIDEPPVVIEDVPQPTGPAGAHAMSMSFNNGSKTVDIRETGRTTHIEESAAGIKMQVTGQIDGKEVTREYKAPNAQKLQKQNPQAFSLYARYMGGGMTGVGPIRIQGGNGIGVNNINIRMNVVAGGGGVNIGPVPPANGLLGITVGQAAEGVLVLHIIPESRAAKMGVKEHDVIQKLNGRDIHSADDLRKAMAENPKELALDALREGKPVKLTEEKKAVAPEQKKE